MKIYPSSLVFGIEPEIIHLMHVIFAPNQAQQKARRLFEDLGTASIGYWSYLQRAFLQARAFKPCRSPVSAIDLSPMKVYRHKLVIL